MFKSDTVYKNRYGDEYSWIADGDAYRFEMTGDGSNGGLGAWVSIGRVGSVSPGMTIDGKPITRLTVTLDGVKAECAESFEPIKEWSYE
jgi:hypothetical protein